MKRLGKRLSRVMAGAHAAGKRSIRGRFGDRFGASPGRRTQLATTGERHGASLPKECHPKIPKIAAGPAQSALAPILLESGGNFATIGKTPARRTHTWTWESQDARRWFARRARGSGRGCAEALAAEGVNLTIVARTAETARGDGRRDSPAKRRAGEHGRVATSPRPRAGPRRSPPVRSRTFWSTMRAARRRATSRNFTHDDWIRALESNMLTPIELIRATIDSMSARGFGRIVNITSSAVKAPIDVQGLSNGRAFGPDRLCRGPRAQDGADRRHDQQPAAGHVRHGSHRRHDGRRRQNRKTFPSIRRASSA